MKYYPFHERWGNKYGIPSEVVHFIFLLIDEPLEQAEYLNYLIKITEWWDDKDAEFIPVHIRKDCKTVADRVKAEQKYKKCLGVCPSNITCSVLVIG